MTRRISLALVALVGIAGLILVSGSPASAQFPFDIGAFLRNLFGALSGNPFFSAFQSLFASILQSLTGSCAPFCSS